MITPLPTPPKSGDSGDVFSARADAILSALHNLADQINDTDIAVGNALQGIQLVFNTIEHADAPWWVSGTTYSYNDVVRSRFDGLLYRGGVFVSLSVKTIDPAFFNDVYIWEPLSNYYDVSVSGFNALENKKLQSCPAITNSVYIDTAVTGYKSISQTVNCHDLTLIGNVTLSFIDAPSTVLSNGQTLDIIIRRTGGASYTVTWPAGVVWESTGLTAPADASIAYYQVFYSSSANGYIGRLVGYKA